MARIWVALLVSATTAYAQPASMAPTTTTVAAPEQTQMVLPNLFASTVGTTVEVRLDYSDIDQIDLTIINTLIHVQYLTPQGFGGYARLPFGYVEEDDSSLIGGVGGSGIGNLEIGGLFVQRIDDRTDLIGRAGVSIDTTSEDDDLVIGLSTVLPRLIDTYASGTQTTWGRGQAQIKHAANSLRLGAALGMDVPVAGDGADAEGFTGLVHAVLAAGFQQGQLGLGFSFVMVQPVTDEDDENTTGLNLGADYLMNPNARIFLQLGMSLEDNADGTSFGIGTRGSF